MKCENSYIAGLFILTESVNSGQTKPNNENPELLIWLHSASSPGTVLTFPAALENLNDVVTV